MRFAMRTLATGRRKALVTPFVLTTLAAILAAGPVSAQANLLAGKSREAQEIIDAATANGHVRVLVEFAQPYDDAAITGGAAALDAAQDKVRAGQDAILEAHFGSATAPLDGPGFPRAVVRPHVSPLLGLNVTAAELDALAADPQVTAIYLSHEFKANLNETLPLIGMPAAYANGGNGAGHFIVVMDTGIQAAHEFITSAKIATEGCFSTNHDAVNVLSLCANGGPIQVGANSASAMVAACDNGGVNLCAHGTHVAGIAAGFNTSPSGGEPPSGVARAARIVPIQIFHRHNDAATCNPDPAPCLVADLGDVATAMSHVIAMNGVSPFGERLAAVNLSLGGTLFAINCDFSPLTGLVNQLRSQGVATIAATGDGGQSFQIEDPACISTVIAVGSATKSGTLSPTSNSAFNTDLLAPGSGPPTAGILSAVPNNTYASFSGTSFAAAHVAGAFAAIRSACPTIKYNSAGVDIIQSALAQTGTLVPDTRFPGGLSKPLIRVDLAIPVACAAANVPPPPVARCEIAASPSFITVGQTTEISWTSSNVDDGFIDNGIGHVGPSGSRLVTLFTPTTFRGTFTGPLGITDCFATVLVFERQTGAFEPVSLLGLSGLAWFGLRRRRKA